MFSERYCAHCGGPIPESVRMGAAYCGRSCRNAAHYVRLQIRVIGWTDVCVDCGHPEDFHTIPRSEQADTQNVLVDASTNRRCSQLKCSCGGYKKPVADTEWNQTDTSVLRQLKVV